MRQIFSILHFRLISGLSAVILLITGCSSPKNLIFADRDWHISNYYGQMIDKDTTYRFTFGNNLIPYDPAIISCADSVARYPGMEKLIRHILHTAHLDDSEILFYAPELLTMFVKPGGSLAGLRPSSITAPMDDDYPYTMWFYEDDVERWERKSSEMYSYVYFDKRGREFIMVDCYDYGDTPIAQITILSPNSKSTANMKMPGTLYLPFYSKNRLRKRYHLEKLSNHIEARHERAISNYKIGQEQKLIQKCR